MLMIGIAGHELTARERDWLRARSVAGVLLFARNFASRAQVSELIESMRKVATCERSAGEWPDDHLLIAVDQEGGPVQRFREGFTRLPALAKIGAVYDHDPAEAVRLAEEHAWVMASEMRAIDVDFSFAPVVDLARGNAAIGTRALHADPMVVAELAQAYVRGMHLAGMAAVLKHFPGHGSVAADTHKTPAIDPRSLDEIRCADLVPFAQCIEARVEAVMMAHVCYPAVDAALAGYSSRWIDVILRDELGFRGVVISDDISMAAAGVAGSVGARVSGHLDAGCDLVLACFPEVVEEALAAVVDRPPIEPERFATLRGNVAPTWDSLAANAQRNRFIARISALDTHQESA